VVASVALSDPDFVRKAALAVDWLYRRYRREVFVPSFEALKAVIWDFENEDPDELQGRAVKALIDAGYVADAWSIEVFRHVVRATGKSQEDAIAYAKDLEGRAVVRVRSSVGEADLPDPLYWWEECNPKA
jgi:hypothetical protein